MSSLAKVLIVFIASFAVAVALFLLFDTNEAAVAWGGDVVKLGGPIAGFIATFLITTRVLERFQVSDAEVAALVARARAKEVEDLVGNWTVTSESTGSGRRAVSETRIEQQGGRLRVTGGTFRTDVEGGGRVIGDWLSDSASFDGDRLIYLYTLTDRTPGDGGGTWRGIIDVRLSRQDGASFEGTWEVFGAEHHAGTIRLAKG